MHRTGQASVSTILASTLMLAGMVSVARTAAATATPGQKCASAKIKAAAKKANAQLTCYAKAITKGTPVDQSCLTKAGTALVTAFQKAEAKGGCATTSDAGAIEGTVDAFVNAIVFALPAAPRPTLTRTPTATTTQTPTATLAGTQTPPTSTPSTTATTTRSPTVTRTPTATLTPTPGVNDCCQSGPFCGPPNNGVCSGTAVVVFNAACSGVTGQCATFTPTPTATATATVTVTTTGTATPTATNTQGP